jgi:hypothetical protein
MGIRKSGDGGGDRSGEEGESRTKEASVIKGGRANGSESASGEFATQVSSEEEEGGRGMGYVTKACQRCLCWVEKEMLMMVV